MCVFRGKSVSESGVDGSSLRVRAQCFYSSLYMFVTSAKQDM